MKGDRKQPEGVCCLIGFSTKAPKTEIEKETEKEIHEQLSLEADRSQPAWGKSAARTAQSRGRAARGKELRKLHNSL